MTERKQYLVGATGEALLDMLRYVRKQTLHAVKDLTVDQLDHRHDPKSNSIGMLLWHIAAVEAWYQVNSFDEREWSPADAEQWDAALDFSDAVEHRGRPLEFYTDLLQSVRARTERELRGRDEAWLQRITPLDDEADANNYWKWFHVCEDEIGHSAQIRWLKKRLP